MKNKNNDYNRYADDMLNKIEQCIQDRLRKMPQLETAVVASVNTDGTYNIYFPPNNETIFTKISNQTPFNLIVGDSVEVLKKGGSWSNCWIVARHCSTNTGQNLEQVKNISDWYYSSSDSGGTGSESSGSESSGSVGSGGTVATKLSELYNDVGFITAGNAYLTGYPTAPTADTNTNNTQIATTNFVHNVISQINYVDGPDKSIDGNIALFDGINGKSIKDSGFTIGKSVPSDAIFTDTIVEVENNLDSTSTVNALSAYQGKLLKNEIDKKATSATTLGGYGITDAYIKDGKVKLGENEIIPITDVSDKAPINSPNFTGTPTVPTANDGDNSEQIANTKFVSKSIVDVLEKSKVMTFQGTLGENGMLQVLPDKHIIGDLYIIISSGIYAGKSCGVGDLIICIQSGETDNNDDWYVIQTNIILSETDTIIEVVDSLNSTETKKALSANQGRVLDEKISKKANSSDSLNGYGILDAKIENNVITLGEHTITFIIDE